MDIEEIKTELEDLSRAITVLGKAILFLAGDEDVGPDIISEARWMVDLHAEDNDDDAKPEDCTEEECEKCAHQNSCGDVELSEGFNPKVEKVTCTVEAEPVDYKQQLGATLDSPDSPKEGA